MPVEVAEEDIRVRAYALWEARGRPNESADEDWFEAERQIRQELDAVASPLQPLARKAAGALREQEPRSQSPSATMTT